MARLPKPGGDQGNWGEILNSFLLVEHDTDGRLRPSGSLGDKYSKPSGGIPASDLSGSVQTALANAGALPPDANSTTKGIMQLAGDIAGSATTPTTKSRTYVTVGVSGMTSDYLCSGINDQAVIAQALAANDTIFVRKGTYIFGNTLVIPSNKHIECEPGTIFRMSPNANKTVITNADAASGMTANVTIKNVIIDQQGTLQNAGGGIVVTGIQKWHLENITIKKSFRFNFLCLHQGNGIANQTGTISVTNGSEVLNGSGTLFTTTLSNGSIVKTPGNQFARISKIISDTQAVLTQVWGFASESGVTYKIIQPNSNNYFRNVHFQGTVDSADASGYGFFDNSIVEDCTATGASAAGCGFVPDHARSVQFINCRAFNNNNSGFSYETCEDILTSGGSSYGNGNGYQLISGSSNCTVVGLECYGNVSHGFSVSFNSPTVPFPVENSFSNISSHDNGGYGLRLDGTDGNTVSNARLFNNTSGGAIVNVANGHIPARNIFDTCQAYDDRTTKIQQRGFYVASGDQTEFRGCIAKDTDHTVAGFTNNGTSTTFLSFLNGNIGINTHNPSARMSINAPTTSDSLAQLMITSPSATSKPVVVQANSGQTSVLMDFQSSAGNSFLNFSAGGLVRGPSASASAPTYSFTQDGSSGMYRPGGVANTIRFATAANDRVQINNTTTTFMHGMQYKRTAVTINYTVQVDDYLIAYTALAAPRTVTLPTAALVTGQTYIIKDEAGAASTNNVTVTTTGGQTIDGGANKAITANYGSLTVYSNGINWLSID